MNSTYARILRTLTLTLFCLLLGPKAARAYEILGHAGWSVSADTQHLLWSNPSTKVYRENTRDARQLHTIRSGNRGGIMYVNKATGGCLHAHDRRNGANPIAHPCDLNNPNQRWEKVVVPGGQFLLRRKGTNLCLDSTGGDRNGQWTHLWTCEGNNQNQRFKFGNTNKIDAFYDYEVWLVSRKRPTWIAPVDGQGIAPGHAFIGVVGRRRDNGQLTAVKAYSFWPESNKTRKYQIHNNSDLTVDYHVDFEQLKDLIEGEQISDRGHAIRKAYLTKGRAEWLISSGYLQGGCSQYVLAGGFEHLCHCMDYSTRLWHYLTGGREDFRIEFLPEFNLYGGVIGSLFEGLRHDYWPDALTEKMNEESQKDGGIFNNGIRW